MQEEICHFPWKQPSLLATFNNILSKQQNLKVVLAMCRLQQCLPTLGSSTRKDTLTTHCLCLEAVTARVTTNKVNQHSLGQAVELKTRAFQPEREASVIQIWKFHVLLSLLTAGNEAGVLCKHTLANWCNRFLEECYSHLPSTQLLEQ